uniref:transposase n=1 Tax=Corynebacterium glutamicum TaxID=1718 RepID=UPI001C8F8B98
MSGALEEFIAEVFVPLVRRDQRSKGRLYLQGLILEGRCKSVQPMGARLGVDHQQVQQFVSSFPRRVVIRRSQCPGPQVPVRGP